jgi:hypothetical protein
MAASSPTRARCPCSGWGSKTGRLPGGVPRRASDRVYRLSAPRPARTDYWCHSVPGAVPIPASEAPRLGLSDPLALGGPYRAGFQPLARSSRCTSRITE